MRAQHPEICLFEPEIPQNTGTIGRLAAATHCRLHLIQPFGFSASDKNLKRAGLDYWPYLDLEIHATILPLIARNLGKTVFLSKKATKSFVEIPTDTSLIVFGRETSGLPKEIWEAESAENFYQIPLLHPGVRSLNLANSVSIIVYDQLRQRGLL